MFTSKPPTCAGRTLALPRKDRDIRYLRPLGNSDIAEIRCDGVSELPRQQRNPLRRSQRRSAAESKNPLRRSHFSGGRSADLRPGQGFGRPEASRLDSGARSPRLAATRTARPAHDTPLAQFQVAIGQASGIISPEITGYPHTRGCGLTLGVRLAVKGRCQMDAQPVAIVRALAIVIAAGSLAPFSATAQPSAPNTSSVPRTPEGHPDLQGV